MGGPLTSPPSLSAQCMQILKHTAICVYLRVDMSNSYCYYLRVHGNYCMGRRPTGVEGSEDLPPRKPLDQHRLQLSVTLDRDHRTWLRENYAELGYRSESHAVDEAIGLLMRKAEADRSIQQSNSARTNRSRAP